MTSHITRTTLSASLLAALLSMASLGAQAQTASPTAPTQASPQSGHSHSHGMGMNSAGKMGHGHGESMSGWHKRQQDALKAKLQLTPAQEGAWSNFTASMQPTAGQRPDHSARMAQMAEVAKLPTPERIERMRALRAQHMAEMNSEMDKRAEATKAFYAALTPEQQKVFDAETSRMMQAWGQRGRGGHGHGHSHSHQHGHEGGQTGHQHGGMGMMGQGRG